MAAFMRTFMSNFSHRCSVSLNNLKWMVRIWSSQGPSPVFAVAACPSVMSPQQSKMSPDSSFESIFDGILLAVPKFRRSLEKRLYRKHTYTSFMEYAMPKKNIIPCLECGHFREKGHLCEHCYEKVRLETKEMQAKMGEDLLFNIPRSEVEFIYDGEKSTDGTFTVKMNKQRPSWFPRELLNKTGS